MRAGPRGPASVLCGSLEIERTGGRGPVAGAPVRETDPARPAGARVGAGARGVPVADRDRQLRASSLLCVAGGRDGTPHTSWWDRAESALRQRTDCVSGAERRGGRDPRGSRRAGGGVGRREASASGQGSPSGPGPGRPGWAGRGVGAGGRASSSRHPAPPLRFGTASASEVGPPSAPRLTFPREPRGASSPGFVLSSLGTVELRPGLSVAPARRARLTVHRPLRAPQAVPRAGRLFGKWEKLRKHGLSFSKLGGRFVSSTF